MCHFIRIEDICGLYLHIIETDLFTILLVSKLLEYDTFFVSFDFLMKVKSDFHISHRQKCPIVYIWSFETPLLTLYKTSCPISSEYGPILAYYE